MALRYLTGTCTQSGNDTLTEVEIPTGLAAIGNQAFRVIEIISQMSPVPNVTGANISITLTRKSFSSSAPNAYERTLLYKRFVHVVFTTSGVTQLERVDRQKYDTTDDLLIVEDPLYLQVSSANTSAANVGQIRIGYQQVRISEVERLQLIANTLSD